MLKVLVRLLSYSILSRKLSGIKSFDCSEVFNLTIFRIANTIARIATISLVFTKDCEMF